MFAKNLIVAYPTDTSFGLGVRADDEKGLEALYALKQRPAQKYTSLMVKDWNMLNYFAYVPTELGEDFFKQSPKTVILKPKKTLPKSVYWPTTGVGFRVAVDSDLAEAIEYPITATSANISGAPNIYDPAQISQQWGSLVVLFPGSKKLDKSVAPSEIWDYTDTANLRRIR